jgi:hypothetical protein
MCTGDSKKNEVAITTRAKDYSQSKEKDDDIPPSLVEPSPPTSPPNGPLHLKISGLDTVLRPPPKGVVRKSAFNPHARVVQNYCIVEDFAQAPSMMSALEVLQSCPAQWKELLKAIGGIDSTDTNLIMFDLEYHVPRLPPQLAFQIQVVVENKNIYRTVIDERDSTCVMSITCWKTIGSPALTESHNTLKAFNGTGFKPYDVLSSLSITLEGKSVNVKVEVFDAPLDYNLLLDCSWIDSMRAVVSTLFHVLCFPHQGKVVIVDQMTFFNSDSHTSNIPFISKTPPGYENVGVGILKDSNLMGTFPIPPPDITPPFVVSINMISTTIHETPESYDPWVVPNLSDYLRYNNKMPLSPVESAYQAIQLATPSSPSLCDSSPDLFHIIFPTNEMIMSVMSTEETPWDDGHHRSILFLKRDTIESYQRISPLSTVVVISSVPKSTNDVFYEGNLISISPTIPLDISIKPGFVENVHIRASCSIDEVHTYKPFSKNFVTFSPEVTKKCSILILISWCTRLRHTRTLNSFDKDFDQYTHTNMLLSSLKLKNFLKLALTDWVSNLVPVNKKQGTICVCVDYRDINKACPKDNYPTPFVDQIVDDCADNKIFSLMDGFSGYNQINILPADQHKTTFIFPWGTFAYQKLPFGLKNVGMTFQRTMSYAFHDIKHIMQPYLDDLPAHSMRRQDHLTPLKAIFVRCRYYHICLNPHKCVFCVESVQLLGFIVMIHGIQVDPLKVEAIFNLPPPSTLCQVQSLQGKEKFLHRFIPNYAELTKGFTQLLKKGYEFIWDDTAKKSFEAMKLVLTRTPLLFPPNYS